MKIALKEENNRFLDGYIHIWYNVYNERRGRRPVKKLAFLEDDDYEGEPYEDVVDDYDGWDDEEDY